MKKWKKYLLYGVIGFLILGTIGACFKAKEDIQAISIQDTQLAMDVNKEKTVEISLEPSDVKLFKSDFVIGDDSIVEIDSIDGNKITLKTLSNEGTTSIYCQRNDVKSNEITIQVTDQKKLALVKAEEQRKIDEKIAEDKKIEEEKIAKNKQAEEAKKAAETKKAQEQKQNAQKSSSKNTGSSSSSTKPTGQKVYITPTGKKYHAIAKCGNTKSSTLVSLSDAQSRGLSACKKCY